MSSAPRLPWLPEAVVTLTGADERTGGLLVDRLAVELEHERPQVRLADLEGLGIDVDIDPHSEPPSVCRANARLPPPAGNGLQVITQLGPASKN